MSYPIPSVVLVVMVQLVNNSIMEDDKLDLFQMGSLIGVAISNCLICIFGNYQMIVGFFIALVSFAIFFIAWLVFTIVKVVRFRKEVKRWKQRNY